MSCVCVDCEYLKQLKDIMLLLAHHTQQMEAFREDITKQIKAANNEDQHT